MGLGAKIGIGVGIVLVIALAVVLYLRKKGEQVGTVETTTP